MLRASLHDRMKMRCVFDVSAIPELFRRRGSKVMTFKKPAASRNGTADTDGARLNLPEHGYIF